MTSWWRHLTFSQRQRRRKQLLAFKGNASDNWEMGDLPGKVDVGRTPAASTRIGVGSSFL